MVQRGVWEAPTDTELFELTVERVVSGKVLTEPQRVDLTLEVQALPAVEVVAGAADAVASTNNPRQPGTEVQSDGSSA